MRRRPSPRSRRSQPDFLFIPGSRGLLGRALLGVILWAIFGLGWLIWKLVSWLAALAS